MECHVGYSEVWFWGVEEGERKKDMIFFVGVL
jgi:hypothetical protein